ncbi:gluconokinase [Terrimonas pollutisoli]|uniref:gluconokinase n=1 Tax=Terrimonas pollutisoli TaxID=3034147 RepID=UPI0023EB6FF2|nr:gluconokinase [Terrimonas sp. H1YJ31]
MIAIIYIMGVSGSGKTTVGEKLSGATGIPFFDADDFHSVANKNKMNAGHPLNDDDRKEWLQNINEKAREEAGKKGAIIACSALKENYRNVLAGKIACPVYWVFLQGDYQLIHERINDRKGHFMPAELLRSQFEILEAPANGLVIDISKKPDEIVKIILRQLNLPTNKVS